MNGGSASSPSRHRLKRRDDRAVIARLVRVGEVAWSDDYVRLGLPFFTHPLRRESPPQGHPR
jgi:hypothetical protein